MKKRKLIVKIIVGILVTAAFFIFINSIPTWSLKHKKMRQIEGNWVTVYYEKEEDAAMDVLSLIEHNTQKICNQLGFTEKEEVSVYIYDNQKTMQRKKYGLIAPFLGLDWYIGDNIGTNVILTSPANPGNAHDYNSVKYAVLHELTHAYGSLLNPHLHLWLKEGLALYLTNGEPFYSSYLTSMSLPSYSDIKTTNPVRFANIGGYNLSHTYIEYLDVTYGWDKVLELIRTENYNKILGVSDQYIYEKWIEYLKHYKQ